MSFEKTAKVISGVVRVATTLETWPFDNGDPFWAGGSQPKYYRWEVICDISTQTHSDPRTRRPNGYDGYDITVGDYFADTNGKVLKVVKVLFKNAQQIKFVAEDVNRYNIFSDPSKLASGAIAAGAPVVFFELSDEGNPILSPFPEDFPAVAYVNIVGRFDRNNPSYFFQLSSSDAANLVVGDFVSITPDGHFVKTSRENNLNIGRVTHVNAPAGNFAFMPSTKLIDNLDYLPGDPGSILYASESGVDVVGDAPVMVKLKGNTQSSTTSALVGPTEPGSSVYINGTKITLMEGTPEELIREINYYTGEHRLVAEPVIEIVDTGNGASFETKVTSDFNQAFYGEPAAFMASGPLRCKVNGVEVAFTTTTDGAAIMGDPAIALGTDMVVDLQAAGIPDLVFSYEATGIVITHPNGGDIIIENLNLDDSGVPFAGDMSCSGLPLSTIGVGGGEELETQTKVKITAPDARAITFKAVTGSTLIDDFGLFDVENGEKAVALSLVGSRSETRTAGSSVVPNIASRDLLEATVGDQAMVLDKGDGEWGLYLHNGSTWVAVATEESAVVDARTVSTNVSVDSETIGTICEVNSSSTVVKVDVHVTEAFASDAVVELYAGDDLIMDANSSDLTTVGHYVSLPNFKVPEGGDTNVTYDINFGSSTSGKLTVSVSYS